MRTIKSSLLKYLTVRVVFTLMLGAAAVAAIGQVPVKTDTTGVKVDSMGVKGGMLDTAGVNVNMMRMKVDPTGVKADTVSPKTLASFTVQGSRPLLQFKPGKIILNVAESPIAAGGTATDVIGRMPGVDGLQWHGKTLTVLIDGRNTGLKGDDLRAVLDGMAAGTLDRIELIEHPSARYDASGGAVLNIITVKVKKAGFNGTITSGIGAGRYAKLNEGFTLNYRKGKVNLYAGYDYLHGNPFYKYFSDRRIDSLRRVRETTDGTRRSNNHSFRIGMDYEMNASTSAGIQVKGIANIRKGQSVNHSLLNNAATGQDSLSQVRNEGRSRYFIPSMNLWLKKKFDSAGKELSLNVDYLRYSKKWNETFQTRYYDPKGQEYNEPYILHDQSPANNSIISVSADYVIPARIGRFETGMKSSFTKTDNDILWEQGIGGGWVTDKGKSNHFIYRENINAAYINYGKSWKKFDLQVGLRAEQTNSRGTSVTLDRVDKRNYLSLFPNASVQYALTADQQLGVAYRRGIERFGFDVVNPFVRYISQYSYSQGNPDIRPSTSHHFDLSYSWKDELMGSVSYEHYLDAPGTVFTRSDTGDAVISMETNLGTADQIEADLTWSKSFFNGKLTTTNTAGAMYAKYNMITDPHQAGARWTVLASSSNTFTFGKGWKAEVSAMYYSPFLLGVYSFRSRFSFNMGVSKTVMHDKGRLALNVTDVFNSFVNKYDVVSYGVLSYNSQKSESQVVKLVFTYKFGGKAQKNGAGRKTGIEDLRGRMSN